jgi:hypothetical protein
VDYFRERGRIMIATEAGAEGINLQFCSLVINYDLPWNPQRIEQRIGRCHRYGQKHDVVVVNFLNRENEADRRVYELLDQKFRLFDGVFGASDEVLGVVESGVDFERRIAEIYQNCRDLNSIHTAFEKLQLDLAGEISDAMLNARKALLENFDEDVQERLRIAKTNTTISLDRMERLLMRFSQAMLGTHAVFDLKEQRFTLNSLPPSVLDGDEAAASAIPLGRYELPRRSDDAHVYRLQHPLAQGLLKVAQRVSLQPAKLILDYDGYGAKVSVLEALRGHSGIAVVQLLHVQSLGATDEYLLAASSVELDVLDGDVTEKLLALPGSAVLVPRAETPPEGVLPPLQSAGTQSGLDFGAAQVAVPRVLQEALEQQKVNVISRIEVRNLSGDALPDIQDKHNHIWDAVRYALEPLISEPGAGIIAWLQQSVPQDQQKRDRFTDAGVRITQL